MQAQRRIIEKDSSLKKDDLIVFTGTNHTFIKKTRQWEPNINLDKGLAETHAWIKPQDKKRQAGDREGVV